MITDEEIQKIFDWANQNYIENKGVEEESLGSEVLSWRKGIPRRKTNLLDMEYFELDSWRYRNISIPNYFFKLPNLKGLSLSLKQYHKIDRKNLEKITFLKISTYEMSKKDVIKFIDSLDTFIELEYLAISDTNLEKIPEIIFTLSNLKYLKLACWDELIELSSDIKKLNKLEVLFLTQCSLLKKIPKEIGSLTKLRELNVRWSDIKKLPEELANLVNLERLNGEPYIRINNEKKNMQVSNIILSNKQFFSNNKIGNLPFPHKNLLLKGVPGTGKSRAIEKIINDKLELEDHKQNILRINIHSASSNADLMQGIGISSNNNGQIEYKEKQGLILNFIEKATFNPDQPFVLILEEIQENSLNELIGDLIYLIEKDKRAKNIIADDEEYGYQELVEKIVADNPETTYVEIPYLVNDSTKYRKMIMPNNLYIFCTSNYRDDKKVIEDNLLRRFEVLEIYPKIDVVHEYCKEFFSQLNENILEVMSDEIHSDRFLIGHSNWLKVENQEAFYRAFLKVVVEFKDIKEVDFSDFKEIVEKLPLVDALDLSSYKALIEDLQTKAGYDFLD
jgi:hypothetical protein